MLPAPLTPLPLLVDDPARAALAAEGHRLAGQMFRSRGRDVPLVGRNLAEALVKGQSLGGNEVDQIPSGHPGVNELDHEDEPRTPAEVLVLPELVKAAEESLGLIETATREHQPSHLFALFSGGHDSLVATALAAEHPDFTAAVHINTGVGIEETRQFVRDTCEREGWPLIEMHPDGKSYRDLVVERGMPGGPKAHNTMFYWLKQRQIRRLVAEYKTHRGDRIGLVTGIRAAESERRFASALAVPIRREGAQLWINPILDWSAVDCGRLLEERGLKRNRVVDLLHRSGECLCGALAHASEIREIEQWFPHEAMDLHAYEQIARDHGHLEDVWAGRLRVHRQQQRLRLQPLCWSCEASS